MKSIIIIGAGPGLSAGLALKFGKEGFKVGLVSRNAEKLEQQVKELNVQGIEAFYATADAYDKDQLTKAVDALVREMGGVDVLLYNAAALKMKDLMKETVDELVDDFKISVANAFHLSQHLYPRLKETKGSILLTGGGFAIHPSPMFGSLSLGKAGLRSLAYQMNQALKSDEIYVGTVSIDGYIQHSSETHSPAILADLFWKLYTEKDQIEIHY
jgi:short-subunit dehydrogenase